MKKSFLSRYESNILEWFEGEKIAISVDSLGNVTIPRGVLQKHGKPAFWLSDLKKIFNRKVVNNVRASTGDCQRFLNLLDEASADNARVLVFGSN
jgi:hypothetical protein